MVDWRGGFLGRMLTAGGYLHQTLKDDKLMGVFKIDTIATCGLILALTALPQSASSTVISDSGSGSDAERILSAIERACRVGGDRAVTIPKVNPATGREGWTIDRL